MMSLPLRSIWTGKTSTKPTSRASTTGAQRNVSCLARPRRKPTPIPRKLPSSTKFEKYDR